MKRMTRNFFFALLVLAMAVSLAPAKQQSKDVTFDKDVMVGSTLVKNGTYRVTFDDQTGELTISKDKQTIAKTSARLEKTQGGRYTSVYSTRAEGDANLLLRINMGKGYHAVIGSNTVQSTPAADSKKG
jgi:hypothetical protein